MKVTYYGHSAIGVEVKGKHILFDPFISPNEKAAHINIEELKADYILLSHGHADHVADVETIAQRTNAKIVSNWEIHQFYQDKGFDTHPMNHGGHWKFDFGTVKYVAAVHSSSFPDGTYAGNPGGFVIWNEDHCFYFSGDTALTMDMKLIPQLCPKLDLAILPIGDNFTMNAREAAMAAEFIACDRIIGCHYDTFGFIEVDHMESRKVFESKGKELILLAIGETLEV